MAPRTATCSHADWVRALAAVRELLIGEGDAIPDAAWEEFHTLADDALAASELGDFRDHLLTDFTVRDLVVAAVIAAGAAR